MTQNSLAFLNLLDIVFGREINCECVLLDRGRSNSCIKNGCCKACYSKGLWGNDVDATRATWTVHIQPHAYTLISRDGGL